MALSAPPTAWLQLVNQPQTEAEVAALRCCSPSRSALRRSELGHGHGQAIGARMHGSAPWKTEETIVGLPRLLVLSAFSRLVAVTFQLPGNPGDLGVSVGRSKRGAWNTHGPGDL